MKYVDKKFIAYKERKSEESINDKSDRNLKRELKRKHYLFYIQYLCKNIDKLWWNNIKSSDKDSIISHFELQYDFINNKKEWDWYSSPVFETWKEWFEYIKSEYKPNKANLRNDRLKLLGI
jgi:hypothetical protein